MPSISQAKLDELNSEAETAKARAASETKRSQAAETRVARFDDILDKITRAAEGRPLIEERNRGYGGVPGYLSSIDSGHQCQPPSAEEVLRRQVDALNERIIGLESRLAAVVAVATFAKEHKS